MNFAGKGGTEKYIADLAEELIEEKHNVHFIYHLGGMLGIEFEKIGITPVQIKMSNPFDFSAVRKIIRYCRINDIDIIHAQHQREHYIAILVKLLRPKTKVVFTCHFAMEQNGLWKLMNSVMTRMDDAVIAVCDIVRRYMILNRFPRKKIQVIYNGVKCDEDGNADGYDTESLADELGIALNFNFVFVTLTRFSEEKGNMFLLESIRVLKEKTGLQFKVIFVGDGDLLEQCKAFAEEHELTNEVIFTGYRLDTDAILTLSKVYINCSSKEALSFAIIEAMAKGLPAIVTNTGGNVEIVNRDTACGLVVDYGDCEAMADAMHSMMFDHELYDYVKANAFETVRNMFNSEFSIGDTIEVYKSLLDESKISKRKSKRDNKNIMEETEDEKTY
jgi:glycosyltransferase involved in cell wall biosynthesis